MLLVLDAKPLLFVKNHQPKVLEAHIRRQHAVGANHHVDGAITQTRYHFTGLLLGVKPGETRHLQGEWGIPLGES